MRISDWSSDVCSSDLIRRCGKSGPRLCGCASQRLKAAEAGGGVAARASLRQLSAGRPRRRDGGAGAAEGRGAARLARRDPGADRRGGWRPRDPGRRNRQACALSRSEEHTSELQSLMRISYAVFCLKKKNKKTTAQEQAIQLSKNTRARHTTQSNQIIKLYLQTIRHIYSTTKYQFETKIKNKTTRK